MLLSLLLLPFVLLAWCEHDVDDDVDAGGVDGNGDDADVVRARVLVIALVLGDVADGCVDRATRVIVFDL